LTCAGHLGVLIVVASYNKGGRKDLVTALGLHLEGDIAMVRKLLLIYGILSSLVYVGINILVPMMWDGYSSVSQTVSELSAIGAPTRQLWLWLVLSYTLLTIAFGCGVWLSGDRNRPLRIVGGLLIVNGVIGIFWPPMHQRGAEFTLTDTLHIVFSIVTVVIFMLEIGFGAAAFGKRFRLYSIATMIVMSAFGILTALNAPRIAANLPTPWIGIWERLSIGVYLVWVVALAVALLRVQMESRQLTLATAATG